MISRNGTVNLSNMPIASEEIYHPEATKLEVEDPLVETLFSTLAIEDSPEVQWKISKFETTPPVCRYYLSSFLTQMSVYRCPLILLHTQMDLSPTWRALIKVL